MRLSPSPFISLVLVALCGCAKYQFSIVEPHDLAGEIERKGQRVISRSPLEYTFFDLSGDGLGVRVANTTDEPVQLLGQRSYIVDPHGQTHQMAGGTIAPQSFIHFGMPPLMRVYPSGPRFSIGVGTGYYHGGHYGGFGTYWGPPYYDTVVMRPWDWRTGDVRFHGEFALEDEQFGHDFTFRRERID